MAPNVKFPADLAILAACVQSEPKCGFSCRLCPQVNLRQFVFLKMSMYAKPEVNTCYGVNDSLSVSSIVHFHRLIGIKWRLRVEDIGGTQLQFSTLEHECSFWSRGEGRVAVYIPIDFQKLSSYRPYFIFHSFNIHRLCMDQFLWEM